MPSDSASDTEPRQAEIRVYTVLCAAHTDQILTERMWPAGLIPGNHNPGNNSCNFCALHGVLQGAGRLVTPPAFDADTESAYHEAGHVVGYWTQGVLALDAHLVPGIAEGSRAYTTIPSDVSDNLIGIWSGQAASWRLLQHRGLHTVPNRIDVIVNSAMDADDLRRTGRPKPLLLATRDVTDRLIEQRWPAVEAVAAALLQRRYLGRDDIVAILGEPGEAVTGDAV